MKITVKVDIGDGKVIGSVAEVIEKSWFIRKKKYSYICNAHDKWNGAKWICKETGRPASIELSDKINEDAQALLELWRIRNGK